MSSTPSLLPAQVADETSDREISYRIEGALVPVLSIDVTQHSVYFEQTVMLWKHPEVNLGFKPMKKGTLTRMMSSMRIPVIEASGTGQIAFSRDGAGQIVPIHLEPGQELHVRKHQFLAATSNIDYSFERVTSISNRLLGRQGFFIDKFRGTASKGVLWLHGYGNVFEIILAAGESLDVESGAWLYKDPSIRLETRSALRSKFRANSFALNRFTGPGRLGIQSMSVLQVEEAELPRPQQTVVSTLFSMLTNRLLNKKTGS